MDAAGKTDRRQDDGSLFKKWCALQRRAGMGGGRRRDKEMHDRPRAMGRLGEYERGAQVRCEEVNGRKEEK